MSEMIRILVFVCLLFLHCSVHAEPLQGNISHEEQLPELPAQYRAGATFDREILNQRQTSKWFQIPHWLAGSWERKESKHKLLGFIPMTMMDQRVRHYGHQIDKRNGVWHWVRVPFNSVSRQSTTFTVFLVHDEAFLGGSSDDAYVKTLYTCWTVDRYTNVIKKVRRSSQIDQYIRLDDGALNVTAKSQDYNEKGEKIGSIDTVKWTDYRVQPFHLDSKVRQLFVDFLYSTGREALLEG